MRVGGIHVTCEACGKTGRKDEMLTTWDPPHDRFVHPACASLVLKEKYGEIAKDVSPSNPILEAMKRISPCPE